MTSTQETGLPIFHRIRSNITKSFEPRQMALEDIVLIKKRKLWKQGNYDCLEACLEAELQVNRFPLPRGERWEAVSFLHTAGLSPRAIAAALGISRETVWRDLHASGAVRNGQPVPSDKIDGACQAKTYPTTRNQSSCLTDKLFSVLDQLHQLGDLATESGALMSSIESGDLLAFKMEELEQLADHIYRGRHALRNCIGKLQDGPPRGVS